MDPIENAFINFLGCKKDERVLVLTDTLKEDLGNEFYQKGRGLELNIDKIVMEPLEKHGQEPPEDISDSLFKYDVIFMVTSKSLSHTYASKRASDNGARIASMPGITEEIINRCFVVDSKILEDNCNLLYDKLYGRDIVKVMTDKGTNISFSIKNRPIIKSTGILKNKGQKGNLPGAEIYVAPIEDSANGSILVDASVGGIGKVENLKIDVSNGIITNIKGDKKEEIKELFIDKKDKTIAEFGIGVNPYAKVTGNILEDEKVNGTTHIGFGTNKTFGGENKANIHIDMVFWKPTVYIDDELIIKDGSPIAIKEE